MKLFLYLELFSIIILSFVISYKVVEQSSVTKKIIYTQIKKIKIIPNIMENKDIIKKEKFKITTGRIFKKYGYVFINNKKATLNANIRIGDLIKTSSYSYVIIKFSNGGVIKLNPNSKLKIDNLENKKNDTMKLHLILGSVLSHFSKKGKYRINTDTATVGVRGTTFFTQVSSKTQTTICACHGNIEFSNIKYKKEITSNHHKVFSLNSKGFIKNISTLVPEVSRLHNDTGILELKSILKSNTPIKSNSFDYSYSKNKELLKKAIVLIKAKKGKRAIFKLSKIAKKDAYASFLVGKVLYEGIGVNKNMKDGVKWLTISAKKKFPSAIHYLSLK